MTRVVFLPESVWRDPDLYVSARSLRVRFVRGLHRMTAVLPVSSCLAAMTGRCAEQARVHCRRTADAAGDPRVTNREF